MFQPQFCFQKAIDSVTKGLVGGAITSLKNSQWEGLSHILWKNMDNKSHVPNHQPVVIWS